jgi:hypothetical protein
MKKMATLYELLTIVGAGLFIIFLVMFLLNFMSKGYLFKLIKVKGSRGKKQLVLLKTPLEYYPTIGWMEGKLFCWKDRESKMFDKKLAKNVAAQENMFFRLFNMDVVLIDEATNQIIMPNAEIVGGFDSIIHENRVMRALNKPTEDDKKMLLLIIILIIVIISLFTLFFLTYKVIQTQALVNNLGLIANNATTLVGGNV